jgi:hypothetical protein
MVLVSVLLVLLIVASDVRFRVIPVPIGVIAMGCIVFNIGFSTDPQWLMVLLFNAMVVW